MAVGKNKKMGKKGAKKKAVDPFTRKDWYDIKAPAMFATRYIGKTLVNKTVGTKISSDFLKGRVYEVSLGDLNNTEADFRKFRLICEEVQGKVCLTNFHGMTFTRDKLCSIVKKWHTLIEANVAVKTTDGYLLRLFCIGFTKKAPNQVKKTSYAKSSQVRQIRARMVEIIHREVSSCDLKEVVSKLIPDSIGKDIEKSCSYFYPLQDVYIRKVKILKKPKFELGKLLDMHGEGAGGGQVAITTASGEVIESRPDAYEPPVQESV
uniref:Small ribosomal subunit protein eS1 n=1 Tax=Meloidogyne incognita TaxID=6306 RepID=A0A914MI45_MELIC